MYGGKGGGFGGITAGTIILPNTGGHPILAFAAIMSIAVGSAILLSLFGRWVFKRIYS
jgi:hypothetical protein